MIKATKTAKAFFNITIFGEIENLMTIESHYKDQNSLFSTTRHENRTNDKTLKKNKTRYLLVYKGENIK